MDVTALILIEPGMNLNGSAANLRADLLAACTGEQPLGLMALLGRPLAYRLVEALALAGIRRFSVVSSVSSLDPVQTAAKDALLKGFEGRLDWHQSSEGEFWESAEEQLAIALERRSSAALLVRANCYFELGSAMALATCTALPFVRMRDAVGDLDVYWATSNGKAQAIDLLRAHMRNDAASRAPRMVCATYANRLERAADLRRLTDDTFNLRLAFRPGGREIRPGVWAGEGTHIHKTARIVAPAHLGDHVKVRAAALVTRGSSIEQYCEVDCGTVVESSNVLPYTYVGAGLELLHSVAGALHIASAAKSTTTEISDAKLLNSVAQTPGVRLIENIGELASFLPVQMFKGMLAPFRRSAKSHPPDVGQAAIATRIPAAAETAMAAGLAARTVTREHGNE